MDSRRWPQGGSLDPGMVAQVRPQQDQEKYQEDWEKRRDETKRWPSSSLEGGHEAGQAGLVRVWTQVEGAASTMGNQECSELWFSA